MREVNRAVDATVHKKIASLQEEASCFTWRSTAILTRIEVSSNITRISAVSDMVGSYINE